MSEPIGFGAMAIVLVLLAAIADHAISWGTGVAVLLTAHSLWRQRRTEARVERRLAQVRLGPPQEPWPAYWPRSGGATDEVVAVRQTTPPGGDPR